MTDILSIMNHLMKKFKCSLKKTTLVPQVRSRWKIPTLNVLCVEIICPPIPKWLKVGLIILFLPNNGSKKRIILNCVTNIRFNTLHSLIIRLKLGIPISDNLADHSQSPAYFLSLNFAYPKMMSPLKAINFLQNANRM